MAVLDCKTVMGPVPVPLYADDPAGTAIDFMRQKRSGLVPVVDHDDKFVGLLGGDRLMHFLIPRAIAMMRGDKNVGFLRETPEELRERMQEVREKTIGDLVDRDVKTATLDTPLIEALMLIEKKQFVVPVLDDEGRLAGAISFFTVLHAIEEQEQEVRSGGDAKEVKEAE